MYVHVNDVINLLKAVLTGALERSNEDGKSEMKFAIFAGVINRRVSTTGNCQLSQSL
jgi:hypothetical protein